MSRKRTGMKRKNFPGRKMQRRREALTRLVRYATRQQDDKSPERAAHIHYLHKLTAE